MRMRLAIVLFVTLTAAVSGAIALAPDQGDRWSGRLARHQATGLNATSDRGSATTAGETPAPPLAAASKQNRDKREALNDADLVFATITVRIDPKGVPLAAYQFEVTAGYAFTVVGLDNGGNPTFPGPPRYDRRAARDGTDRLIVADYNATPGVDHIAKPYPVATLHAAFAPPESPAGGGIDVDALRDGITLTLTAAADRDGNRIDADITYDLHLAERPRQE